MTSTRWAGRPRFRLPAGDEPLRMSSPRTELLATAWRRHGLLDPFERPGPQR